MLLTGLLLLRQVQPGLVEGAIADRYEISDGESTVLSSLTWSGRYGAGAKGEAIDIWNHTADVTVVDCMFQEVSNPMFEGGIVYWQYAILNVTRCQFVNCVAAGSDDSNYSYGGILISFTGPASLVVDDCRFTGCQAKDPGGIIYLVYEPDTENDVAITNSRFENCKVGDTDANTRFDAQITLLHLRSFTFSNNVFEWNAADKDNMRSTSLLSVSFKQAQDVVIDGLTVSYTTFPEGLIAIDGQITSLTYQKFNIAGVSCGNESFPAGWIPKRDVSEFKMIDCQFSSGCSTRYGFVDTSVAKITKVQLDNCRFSECTCDKDSGFLFFNTNSGSATDCYFGNIRFFEVNEGEQNQVPYHLVSAEGGGTFVFSGIAFDLPRLSYSSLDLFFKDGYVEFRECSFVVNGNAPFSQITMENYRHVTINTCMFTVDNKNSVTPMVHMTGADVLQLLFHPQS